MYTDKTMEMVKKIRNGESVKCPSCEKGIVRPIGSRESALIFSCDNCNKSLHLTKRL